MNPFFSTPEFKKEYPFQNNYLVINGRKLQYVDEGKGETLVMLHGNPTWSFYYRNLIKHFSPRYRCIAPDHIGCGLSDKPQKYQYTLEKHIDNLEALLVKKLALKDVTFVLHDWGGIIGFGLARRHPGLVKRFVILNTAAFLIPDVGAFAASIKAGRIPLLGAALIRGLNAFARTAIRWCVNKADDMSDFVREAYLAPYDSYENRIATLRFVEDIPLSPKDASYKIVAAVQNELATFKDTPMQIIWGMKDFCFDQSFLDTWKRFFPSAGILELPEAGHYVMEDGKAEVIAQVEKFLAENPLAPVTANSSGDWKENPPHA